MTSANEQHDKFWKGFFAFMSHRDSSIGPMTQSENTVSIQLPGPFLLLARIYQINKPIRCGIIIQLHDAKEIFDRLKEHRPEINTAFGTKLELEWNRLDEKVESQIWLTRKETSRDTEEQYEWLASTFENFHRVFMPYIREFEGIDAVSGMNLKTDSNSNSMKIPDELSTADVVAGIRAYGADEIKTSFKDSSKYDLLHEGDRYPPKAITTLAIHHRTGHLPTPNDFPGGA
jgi:hypothetical protein